MDGFYYPSDKAERKKWNNYTLIMPVISVGNVGQLSIDLLVNSLKFKKVGSILDDSITPVIGNDPYGKSNKTCQLMMACEVYENVEAELVVIQQRSPYIKGRRQQFFNRLLKWINNEHFKMTVVLGSTHAYERKDEQLIGSQLRYLSTKPIAESELMDNVLEYEREPDGSLYLPGSGGLKSLLDTSEQNDLNMITLIKFCMEGDNCMDAIEIASTLTGWLKLGEICWKMPTSWRFLFGTNVDKVMF